MSGRKARSAAHMVCAAIRWLESGATWRMCIADGQAVRSLTCRNDTAEEACVESPLLHNARTAAFENCPCSSETVAVRVGATPSVGHGPWARQRTSYSQPTGFRLWHERGRDFNGQPRSQTQIRFPLRREIWHCGDAVLVDANVLICSRKSRHIVALAVGPFRG